MGLVPPALLASSQAELSSGVSFRPLPFPAPSLSGPFLLSGRGDLKGGSAFPRNPSSSSQISLSRGVKAPR